MKSTICHLLFLTLSTSAFGQTEIEFRIKLSNDLLKTNSISGKLYLVMTTNLEKGSDIFWISPIDNEPIFSKNVTFTNSMEIVINKSNTDAGFPVPLDKIPEGIYLISAAFDMNHQQRHFAYAEGNFYSENKIDTLYSGQKKTIELTINSTYHRKISPSGIQMINPESALLSNFYNGKTFLYAGVVLPPSYYNQPHKLYPVVYVFPEFDNSHYDAFHIQEYLTRYEDLEKIYVVLNPLCDFGNHVFADSENNGPRAESLVNELIPYIEKKFRALSNPNARFLFGHSSGGWAALWLLINYPDFFGGAWSTSPDPVDFRSFYKINIYDSTANVFYNKDGSLRVLDRILTDSGPPSYKSFSDFEKFVDGEQLRSHESVFSLKSSSGQPEPLWDRDTGKINASVANRWRRYDIQEYIRKNIRELKAKLNGKMFIYCGDRDGFYLDHAVMLLRESIGELGLKAEIRILKERDHGDVYVDDVIDSIDHQMNTAFRSKKWDD